MTDVDLTARSSSSCSFEHRTNKTTDDTKKKKMNLVRVSGSIGLGSLWISVISYFLSFIPYLISFSLADWIVYGTVPIKIGIWRLCDIQVSVLVFLSQRSSMLSLRSLDTIGVRTGVHGLIRAMRRIWRSSVHQVRLCWPKDR